jgi:hypothetical protein
VSFSEAKVTGTIIMERMVSRNDADVQKKRNWFHKVHSHVKLPKADP